MAGDDSMLPVKVEFGAKASLEIKGEIPKESMGGLVNALTDAIRPWTEARGLKADQIRLQREDVLLEIAQKARARLLVDCVEPKPLSTKLLIPFLEKASLEDKDVALRDAWASLLVSATKTERARHLTFVDILTRISSQELELLEQICFEYKNFPENYYPGGHAEENRRQIESNARMLVLRPNDGGLSHQAKENFVAAVSLTYARLMHLSVRSQGSRYFYFEAGNVGTPRFQSIEILQRERLVDIVRILPPGHGVEIGYFNVTSLGIDFVRDCSPQADEMAARRPPPVQPIQMSKEESDKVLTALREKERSAAQKPQGGA
jgi:Abortive infection alpha